MGQFSQKLFEFTKTFPNKVNQIIRMIAFETLNNAVLATPRDTGRAASNWFVSQDTPETTTTDETDAEANLNKQSAKLTSSSSSNNIWLVNNLPYIVRLNDGWSKQAPEGFVEKSISAAEKSLGSLIKNITLRG